MTLLAASILADAAAGLLTLYWICLVVGGGLLLISTLSTWGAEGGADVDVDVSTDVDAGIDLDAASSPDVHAGHAHAGSLASWLSMQFIVFFLAMFGAVGVTMSYLTGQGTFATLACALVGGVLIGQGAHQILRSIRRNSGNSATLLQNYDHKIGRVTVAINGARMGEITLRVGEGNRYVPAVARRPDDSFAPGQHVGVVAYRDGVAEVVGREEYEFLFEHKPQGTSTKEDEE